MNTIKLHYTLELEVPEDALVSDAISLLASLRLLVQGFGWKAKVRRCISP